MSKVYLAGPFFNDKQIAIIDTIRSILIERHFNVYSPKDESLFVPGKSDSEEIFMSNLCEIESSDFIIAVTNDKDPGTMWECGYAYAHKIPIVYVWLESENQKFNLMLAESGATVCKTYTDIHIMLEYYQATDRQFIDFNYGGEIE